MTEQEVIHTAAVRAAVVFGREGWTWAGHPDPPSVADIEAKYKQLVDSIKGSRANVEHCDHLSAYRWSFGGVTIGLDLGYVPA